MNNEKETKTIEWKTHTPRLLGEILNNESCAILYRPLQIFGLQLEAVAKRCSELNDPILNKLMCQLALYNVADPDSGEYDASVVEQVFADAESFKTVPRETNG